MKNYHGIICTLLRERKRGKKGKVMARGARKKVNIRARSRRTVQQKFSGCTWYKTKIRERKRQSGAIIQKGELHERNPCAPTFEERTSEETSRQEECARNVVWNLTRKYASSRPKTTTFYSLVKAPERQTIVCLLWIRELQCTMLSKEN